MVSDKIEPDPVFVLDTDRTVALRKMQRIHTILCQLPAIDCGGCGAPNCNALAEDIVQGKARLLDCVFLQNKYVSEQKISLKNAFKSLERKWGLTVLMPIAIKKEVEMKVSELVDKYGLKVFSGEQGPRK